jgi:hypothetical protein
MFRDGATCPLYIGGYWDENLAKLQFLTNILVNDIKYNIPKIGDTLEFIYSNSWIKSNNV